MPRQAERARPRGRRLLAGLVAITGFALLCVGLALVYLPVALAVAGILLMAVGFLVIDVGGRR